MSDKSEIQVLHEGKFLRLVRRGHWEFCQRCNASGVVVILAVTPQQCVLFVEQYRPPVGSNVIEMPAGLAGDISGQEDEALEQAAARELEEETGFRAGRIRRLTTGPASSGMSSEMVTFLLAEDLERVGPGGGDDSEDITVHEIPIEQAGDWLMQREADGTPADPKVFGGLWWLTHVLRNQVANTSVR